MLPPYDMHRQHDILADVAAHITDVPVPSVHGWSEDPTYLGRPFYLLEMLEGESFELQAPTWLTDATPEFRRALSEQWISAVARVSKMAPLETLGEVKNPLEPYERWREMTARDTGIATDSKPLGQSLLGLYDELFAHGLPATGAPTAVHGDPKIANTMWKDGNLTALLDWELAYNGEPLADLAYMLLWLPADPSLNEMGLPGFDFFSLPGMLTRAEAIATWERVSGRLAVELGWYELAEELKTATIVLHGVAAFESGENSDERLAFWPLVIPILVERARRMRALV